MAQAPAPPSEDPRVVRGYPRHGVTLLDDEPLNTGEIVTGVNQTEIQLRLTLRTFVRNCLWVDKTPSIN